MSQAGPRSIGKVPLGFDLDGIARELLPEASRKAAADDPEFAALLTSGTALADAGLWSAAAEAFAKALDLYPYHAGGWLQLARARAGEQAFGGAEIAWRTSAAYGADAGAVEAGLGVALRGQQVTGESWPLRPHKSGPAAQQAPGMPDIVLLARLAWHTDCVDARDCLRLLRTCATLDATFAAMIADPRFARANIDWLGAARPKDPPR